MIISSWGHLSAQDHKVVCLHDAKQAASVFASDPLPGIAHGMGRSYGDVCLNPHGRLWLTTGLDRFISFDDSSGRLICEAGVLLKDIQRLFIPRGWMLPVTPGTQLITVGGAIANDVHGKNHHVYGSFGDHLQGIRLMRTDGAIIDCGPHSQPDWFAATVGGLGLTGVILEASIQLRRVSGPWLKSETKVYGDLAEFFCLADEAEQEWEHTVSWIDCLSEKGRGIFMRARPTEFNSDLSPTLRKRTVPFVPSVSLVNRLSLRPFNALYYHLKKRQQGTHVVHYESFFYPLDHLCQWNRIYGPRGFFQYQSLVPRKVGLDAITAMMREISRSGEGSFLAVLKTFGNRQPFGMMSFPKSGVTLALDFPNHGTRTHTLFTRLDAIVREAQGRIYLAKDARMPRDLFEAGYPRLHEFLAYRDAGISSALSRRLIGY